MPPETSLDETKREKAERAYLDLFSRNLKTPLDRETLSKEFPTQLLSEAGYSKQEQQLLIDTLAHAGDATNHLGKGELRRADSCRTLLEQSLKEIGESHLISTNRLASMKSESTMLEKEIVEKRPQRYQDAQDFFKEKIINSSYLNDDQAAKDTKTFYSILLDSGLSIEQASAGYYAMEDALAAKKIIGSAYSGEPAQQALLELSQSIELLKEINPHILNDENTKFIIDMEKYIQDKRLEPAADSLSNTPITNPIEVFNVDPEKVRDQAVDRAEKIEAVMDWLNHRKYKDGNEMHSLGGFYNQFFDNGKSAAKDLRNALSLPEDSYNCAAERDRTVKRADELLDGLVPNHRNMTAKEVVTFVDNMREDMFKRADTFADLVGAIPFAGSRIKFGVKEISICLRYASGDISATEAVTATMKEGISAVISDQITKTKLDESLKYGKYMKEGGDLLLPLAGAVLGNVTAEYGKLLGRNNISDITPKQFLLAFETGVAKGIVEGGFKICEKNHLGSDEIKELSKFLIKLAHKFGLERNFDQYIDQEIKKYSGAKSVSTNGENLLKIESNAILDSNKLKLNATENTKSSVISIQPSILLSNDMFADTRNVKKEIVENNPVLKAPSEYSDKNGPPRTYFSKDDTFYNLSLTPQNSRPILDHFSLNLNLEHDPLLKKLVEEFVKDKFLRSIGADQPNNPLAPGENGAPVYRPFVSAESDKNLTTALALDATKRDLSDIDRLTLSKDGTRLVAIQGNEQSDFYKTASVVIQDAIKQPANDSLAQIAQLQTEKTTDALKQHNEINAVAVKPQQIEDEARGPRMA